MENKPRTTILSTYLSPYFPLTFTIFLVVGLILVSSPPLDPFFNVTVNKVNTINTTNVVNTVNLVSKPGHGGEKLNLNLSLNKSHRNVHEKRKVN